MRNIYSYCGIRKQSHYAAVQKQVDILSKESLYIGFIEEVRIMHPGMGLRTMYERYEPEQIGRDAFINMGLRHGYRLNPSHRTVRTTFSVKSNRYKNLLIDKEFTDVNQIWTSDITYYKIGEDTYYIVLIMDVYSRRIVGYSVGDNMRAEQNINALQMALDLRKIENYKYKLIHHSDKGGQYISNDYTDLMGENGILISMCNIVYENAHIERVNGTIKNQYLHRWDITSFMQLQKKLENAVWAYNYDRPHKAHDKFGKLSPVEFEELLKEIKVEDRQKLIIYTDKQNDYIKSNNQLELDL